MFVLFLAIISVLIAACSNETEDFSTAHFGMESNFQFIDRRLQIEELAKDVSQDTYAEAFSYQQGYEYTQRMMEFEPVRAGALMQGMTDALLGRAPVISFQDLVPFHAEYHETVKDRELYERGRSVWEALGKMPNLSSSSAGYYYEILHDPENTDAPLLSDDYIQVRYRAYLPNSRGVASNLNDDEPMLVRVDEFPFLEDVFTQMRPGEIRRAFLPYVKAFGNTGTIIVPPYAVVVYEINVLAKVDEPPNYRTPRVHPGLELHQPLQNGFIPFE